jgi:hypothetical protein
VSIKVIFQTIQHKSLCSDNTKSLWPFSNTNFLRVYELIGSALTWMDKSDQDDQLQVYLSFEFSLWRLTDLPCKTKKRIKIYLRAQLRIWKKNKKFKVFIVSFYQIFFVLDISHECSVTITISVFSIVSMTQFLQKPLLSALWTYKYTECVYIITI